MNTWIHRAIAVGLHSPWRGLALAPPRSAADDAHVSVLHGVPDAVVDVYANGEALLTDFEPGTLTDPVALPGGDYDLKVVAAGDGPDGDADHGGQRGRPSRPAPTSPSSPTWTRAARRC